MTLSDRTRASKGAPSSGLMVAKKVGMIVANFARCAAKSRTMVIQYSICIGYGRKGPVHNVLHNNVKGEEGGCRWRPLSQRSNAVK
jgi:hypothetical protein